jgi:hypothetical protein
MAIAASPEAPGLGKAAALPRLAWLGFVWLAVYVPAYAWAYGLANFLFLCNIGVMLTAVGLIVSSRLLLSSQAVAAPVIALAWGLDAGWRLVSGHHLYGGTEYMWDASLPAFTRALSLYHVFWPLLLFACLRRGGYDRRGWSLQATIAAGALAASRLATPAADNINFAFRDPFFHRQLGPAPLHLACVWLALAGIAYGLTHLALRRALRPPPVD